MGLCDICKKQPSKIQITGEGEFCLDCYNKAFLERAGIEDTYEDPRQISVVESDGMMHSFNIEHVILGDIVSWDAYEIGGDYHFRECSDIDENGAVVAQRFFKKIIKGVCTKSLEVRSAWTSNLAHIDGKSYSVKNKGIVNIIEDEERDYDLAFVVDGIKFEPEEFCRLFGGLPGFNIHFQIHDASDPLLGENEYLVPVLITRESLLDELQSYINIHGDRGFIDYKHVLAFDTDFEHVAKKLSILMEAGDYNKAVEIGKEIINKLKAIETDDDYFPFSDIEVVRRIIDPHRINPELWK